MSILTTTALFLFFTAFLNAQEKLIIGTWNTVTVSNDMFQMNENKEFELTKKGKIIHNSKDAILNLKLGYSENQFVFDENNNFFVKLSENSNFFVFLEGICIPVLNTIHIREETTRNESHTFFRQDLPTKGRDVLWQPSLEVRI